MDSQQTSIPSNYPTSFPHPVKNNIETDDSYRPFTVLSLPHKIIEGKSLLNINEQEPLMNSKNGILYYLLDKKY